MKKGDKVLIIGDATYSGKEGIVVAILQVRKYRDRNILVRIPELNLANYYNSYELEVIDA